MTPDDHGFGPTRVRDLAIVAAVAAAVGYALTRFNYGSIPQLPRLAGVSAALLGAGEAVAGWGLRKRIQPPRDRSARAAAVRRPPVPALVAARALRVAKASALAGAALSGLWLGFGCYVVPDAGRAVAVGADAVTAVIGLVCALALMAGALWLEYCCRAPGDRSPGAG